MIKDSLKKKLEAIFGMRVTFDAPSDAFEQDRIFIEVQGGRDNAGSGRITAEYTGALIIYSKNETLAYGFFGKKISDASPDLTKDFFFSAPDTNNLTSPARYMNLTERRINFKYLFRENFQAAQGRMTDVDFSTTIGG